MTELERVRKVLHWLSLCGFGDDDTALATMLGYKNKTSLSQILNGHVPISGPFIKKVQTLDPNVNNVWIREEKGPMLNSLNAIRDFQIVAKDDYNSLTDTNTDITKNMESPSRLIAVLNDMLKEKLDEIVRLRLQISTLEDQVMRLGGGPSGINPGDIEKQKETG